MTFGFSDGSRNFLKRFSFRFLRIYSHPSLRTLWSAVIKISLPEALLRQCVFCPLVIQEYFRCSFLQHLFLEDMVFVMGKMHNEDSKWTRQTSWNERHASKERACYWIQLRNITRSLCEDVHVSQNIEQRVRMVAQLRGGQMVAHDFTDTSFLLPMMTWRKTFFEGNVSTVFTLRFPSVAPVDEIQMEPCLMIATLISWSQAKSSSWDGEWLNPQTSTQLFGIDLGPHMQFPATPSLQFPAGPSLLRVFAGSKETGRSCGGDVEDDAVVELDDSPGPTNGTKFSVLFRVWFPFLVRRGSRSHWATHTCNRALCKVCQRKIRQECPRAAARWRKCEDHAHTLALHSSGPPLWLSPLIWEI